MLSLNSYSADLMHHFLRNLLNPVTRTQNHLGHDVGLMFRKYNFL